MCTCCDVYVSSRLSSTYLRGPCICQADTISRNHLSLFFAQVLGAINLQELIGPPGGRTTQLDLAILGPAVQVLFSARLTTSAQVVYTSGS